jgi:hypothetical protein
MTENIKIGSYIMAFYAYGIILYGRVEGIHKENNYPITYNVREILRYSIEDGKIIDMCAIVEEITFYTVILEIEENDIPKDLLGVKEDILLCIL